MDVYALTKKQRPTHLTRGEVDKTHNMTQPEPQQKQQHQQQQHPPLSTEPPTLKDIEAKHSQLPPQYRQAVLEQQQREHQQRLLQQQQQQQQQASPGLDSQKNAQPTSALSSPNANGNGTGARQSGNVNPSHQRIVSAPLMSSNRSNRVGVDSPNTTVGPSRAHWKPDNSTQVCTWPGCLREFGFFDRRHHCRKCGDIFCSAHCSKAIPLDHSLDFNPAMGVSSRACIGCFESYEQWQGLIPTTTNTTYTSQHTVRGAFGHVSDSAIPTGEYTSTTTTTTTTPSLNHKSSGLLSPEYARKNTGKIAEGYLGQTGNGTLNETLGREDIVRLPKSASDTIAIKTRPVQDPATMPMPSVPHDWSWSTF
ncbi:hypothetical protein BGZ75_003821 [Mortierella antarctica]|nr:hypothetical protein BGZ75_003821 [Mortierella antarctica]